MPLVSRMMRQTRNSFDISVEFRHGFRGPVDRLKLIGRPGRNLGNGLGNLARSLRRLRGCRIHFLDRSRQTRRGIP